MTIAASFPRPSLVVSRCLGFAPVRYDGRVIHAPFVQRLATVCDVTTVCPEVEIGLGVPRPPIRVTKRHDGKIVVLQPRTGRDVTRALSEFSARFLRSLPTIDGFVLKSRSPSCGIRDVKVYGPDAGAAPIGSGTGAFGGSVLERFPDAAVEDEERLLDDATRDRFLTLLFALARLRAIERSGRYDALAEVHSRYASALLAYDDRGKDELDRVVATLPRRPWPHAVHTYRLRLARALRRPPPPGRRPDRPADFEPYPPILAG